MSKLHIFLFFILFCSCSKKENDLKIEIYLVKSRILTYEGVLLKETNEYKKFRLDTHSFYSRKKDEKFDTVTNQLIYGGKYKVSQYDLKSSPLIEDGEILFLYKDSSQIQLSNSGFRKLQNFNYKDDDGRQYVITVNKKPVLNGYLMSRYSSKVYSHNFLLFDEIVENEKPVENHPLEIFCVNSYIEFSKNTKTDLNNYPLLINAFKKTDRLK